MVSNVTKQNIEINYAQVQIKVLEIFKTVQST